MLVVVEIAMTETAQHADYVLPGKTGFENHDFSFFPLNYPEVVWMLRHPVIGQIGERKEDAEVILEIARAMGVVPEMPKDLQEAAAKSCREKDIVPFMLQFMPYLSMHPEYKPSMVLIMMDLFSKPECLGSASRACARLAAVIDNLPEYGVPQRAGFNGKLEQGAISMEHVCAALHKIGIRMVVSDTHAKYLAAQQAAKLIEQNVSTSPVILTNSMAVMNFVERFFPEMKERILTYDSAQTVFGRIAPELTKEKSLKTVNITAAKEFGAEAKESHNVDYVLNARELYRIFMRTGGAPAKRKPMNFDQQWADKQIPYAELLGDKVWNMEAEPEQVEIHVQGKMCKCAVAHNLGQVRRLLGGEWRSYDIIRLMA